MIYQDFQECFLFSKFIRSEKVFQNITTTLINQLFLDKSIFFDQILLLKIFEKFQHDSGGPLWQYYNGRAVIVGVTSLAYTDTEECSLYGTIFVRVSRYIDWIISVTKMDVQHLTETNHTSHFTDYFRDIPSSDAMCNMLVTQFLGDSIFRVDCQDPYKMGQIIGSP